MVEEKYTVYVKADENGRIVAINSDAFLRSLGGWVAIDSGYGDKYHHAQNNYLESPLMNERDVWLYKLVDGAVVKRTQDEIDADVVYAPDVEQPVGDGTVEQRCEALEAAFAALVGGVEDARN